MCSHALSTLNCVGAGAQFKWWEWSVGSVVGTFGLGLGLGLGIGVGLGIDQLYLWDGEAELVDQRSLRAQPGHSVRQALLDLRLKAVR